MEERIRHFRERFLTCASSTLLSVGVLREIVANIVIPFLNSEEDWKQAVIMELVRERWDAGDLYTLLHHRRSNMDIFYDIQSMGIERESVTMSETDVAIHLCLPKTTVKVEILQNLHGYTASIDWMYSFLPTRVFEHISFAKTLSLHKLLNMGEKLPVNEEDKIHLETIRILDNKFDFSWKLNEYKGKDVMNDPRGYRYKYGRNVFRFTCLHNNPYRWNFLKCERDE